MSKRSKSGILKLPSDVVQQVDAMLVEVGEKRRTYDEIVAWVADQGHSISRSALSRYFKYVQALEKVKLVSQQVKAIIDEAGTESPLELEEGTSKLGAVVMMEVFQEAMKDDAVDVKHIGRLMGDFAKLQRASVARERLKMDFAKKAKKAVDAIESKTRKKSLDPETLRIIREEIYGIV